MRLDKTRFLEVSIEINLSPAKSFAIDKIDCNLSESGPDYKMDAYEPLYQAFRGHFRCVLTDHNFYFIGLIVNSAVQD